MSNRILKITDGTSTVNLLNLEDGYSVDGWRQQIAQYKGGGSWSESALSDGRQLIDYRYGNIPEVVPLDVSGGSQETVIAALRDLQTLLTKAADYWRYEWRTEFVWLEKRAACEEEISYALIYTGAIPDVADIFGYPFEDGPMLEGLQINLERGQWGASIPGTGTQEPLAQFQTYNSKNFGNTNDAIPRVRTETTNLDRVYIANKNNIAQLTHVYNFTLIGAVFLQVLGTALPYELMPAVPAVGDEVMIGIQTTVADSGPFCSVVFDLSQIQVDLTCQWEYWNGGWAILPAGSYVDYTDSTGEPFTRLGRSGIYFRPQDDWIPVAVNGVTAYWIRCTVTAIGVGPVPPIQQNNDPYTVTWGSIPIEEGDIVGDIPALLKLFMHNRSSILLPSAEPQLSTHRYIVGLRSDSRGTDFSAYLNAAREQNPTGVTVTEDTPGFEVTETRAPAGLCMEYTAVGATEEPLFKYTFTAPTTAAAYHGIFRIFVRVSQRTGAAGAAGIRLRYFTGESGAGTQINVYRETAIVFAQSTDPYEILDMGIAVLPGRYPPGVDTRHGIHIITVFNAAATMQVYDLILIPVDEWAADIRASDVDEMTTAGRIAYPIHLDSLTVPKHFIHARQVNTSDVLQSWWTPITNGPAILQPTTGQKLWVLATNVPDGETYEVAPIPITSTVGIWHNERFLLPRGTT